MYVGDALSFYKYVSINGYLARINRFQGLSFRAFVAYEKLS